MKNIFVFPGQGAHVNKIKVLTVYDSGFYKKEMDMISEAMGFDVMDFALQADAATLSQVKYTQIVMFAASVAFLSIAESYDLYPDIAAGHSIGQYAALYAAGVFDLFELSKLIKARAEIMSLIPADGKLCAIKSPFPVEVEFIEALCKKITDGKEGIVQIALYNSDKQIVVGGNENALLKLHQELESSGYSVVILPVGKPFHTGLMEEMLEPFSKVLTNIPARRPKIPVILNTTAEYYTDQDLKQELLNHCVKPVRWHQTMEKLLEIEDTKIYEVGLGHTLSGFFRNISKRKVITMEDKRSFSEDLKNRSSEGAS